jgi:hypothetical protein
MGSLDRARQYGFPFEGVSKKQLRLFNLSRNSVKASELLICIRECQPNLEGTKVSFGRKIPRKESFPSSTQCVFSVDKGPRRRG